MGMFLVVLYTGAVGHVGANVVAKLAVGLFAFVAHSHFTFRVVEGVAARGQVIRYFVLLGLNIPVATAILALLLKWITEQVAAKLIADVVCVGLIYLTSKHFIFTDRRKQSNETGPVGVGA
jgi:putative flippase GtrA